MTMTILKRCLVLSAAAMLLAGCNTVRGVGKDIERAGEVIQGRSAHTAPAAAVQPGVPTTVSH